MKEFIRKYSGLISALALVVTSLTVNSTCIFTMHQDTIPEEARKLSKY